VRQHQRRRRRTRGAGRAEQALQHRFGGDLLVADVAARGLRQDGRHLVVVQRFVTGQVEGLAAEAVVQQQLGGHRRDVARIDEAAACMACGQQDAALLSDALHPEGVEVLHEPVRADGVPGQARGFEVQLGLAHGAVVVGVRAHGRHQHHLLDTGGARLVDQRQQQVVLWHITRRRHQEGTLHAAEGRLQALGLEHVDLHLVEVGGSPAGGLAHGLATRRERLHEGAADGAAGADDEVLVNHGDEQGKLEQGASLGAESEAWNDDESCFHVCQYTVQNF